MKFKKFIFPIIALFFFLITGYDFINAWFCINTDSPLLETLLFIVSLFNLILAYKLDLKK